MTPYKDFFQQDRFAVTSGVELLSAGEGMAEARLVITPDHLNAAGTVQGGAIFTLADLALAAAANSRGQLAVSIHTSINFFRGTKSGTLTARATERNLHPKVATYQVDVTDPSGALVATVEATFFRKQNALEVSWE